MVNEREDRYDSEEGEYHFSDDQMNYDMEAETKEEPPVVKASPLSKLGAVTSRRRVVLAGIVFIILIGIVYKMLAPSNVTTSTVPTEFNKPTKTPPVAKVVPPPPVVPSIPAEPSVPVQTVTPVTPVENKPVAAPEQVVPPAPPVAEQQTIPAPTQPVTTVTTTTTPQTIETVVPPPPVTSVVTETKSESDKLILLEQQNTAIMNLLQTEYAQKMADYETQNTSLRGKVDEMSRKINKMEASINQISQLLQQGEIKTEVLRPAISRGGPKVSYNVQAIIPGRAWLKSDSGDTVTVAEGDILRNVGRVIKIDPYDGIVEIDMGNKVITLSYGMSVE